MSACLKSLGPDPPTWSAWLHSSWALAHSLLALSSWHLIGLMNEERNFVPLLCSILITTRLCKENAWLSPLRLCAHFALFENGVTIMTLRSYGNISSHFEVGEGGDTLCYNKQHSYIICTPCSTWHIMCNHKKRPKKLHLPWFGTHTPPKSSSDTEMTRNKTRWTLASRPYKLCAHTVRIV